MLSAAPARTPNLPIIHQHLPAPAGRLISNLPGLVPRNQSTKIQRTIMYRSLGTAWTNGEGNAGQEHEARGPNGCTPRAANYANQRAHFLVSKRPTSGAMANGLGDPDYIEAVRIDMMRFARLQLGNDSESEDVVQEALTAAVRDAGKFRSDSALKTWIIAILKHKIADILRQRQRRPILASEMADRTDSTTNALFDRRGMWRDAARPATWENPEALINNDQILAVFDACLDKLPPQHGRVFLMREVVGLETEEICRELEVSPGNLRVILHRARLALRACLEQNGMQP